MNPKLLRVLIMGACGLAYGAAVQFLGLKVSFDTIVAMVTGLGVGSQALPQVGSTPIHPDDAK